MPLLNRLGATGPAGLTWRGVWSGSNTYNKGDLARRINVVYFCNANGITTDPLADNTNWALFLQDGINATNAKSLIRLGGNKVSTAATGSLAITVPVSGHPAGNLLVIPVMVGNSGAAGTVPVTVTGVADNHAGSTNVYTIEAASPVITVTNQYRLQLCWCILSTTLASGDIITVTFSGSTQTDLAADSAEFTNVTARDVAAISATPTGTTIAAGNITPSVNGDLLVAVYSAAPTTVNNGQTPLNQLTAAGGLTRAFNWTYALLPSTATINPSETIGASSTNAVMAMLFR